MARLTCDHCGLPVIAAHAASGRIFCCYGCSLVSRIVGNQEQQGAQAWNILRLSIGALLAMNVMMISLLLYTGQAEPGAVPILRWGMLIMATPAMLILGYPFMAGAAAELAGRRLSLDTLVAVGSTAAFAVSAVNTFRMAGHVYFDTATMLPALVTLGRLIEAAAKTRTGRLVRALNALLPASVLRIEADGVRDVAVPLLRAGDRVRVRPGERIAVDGRIIEGHSVIREAGITGEFEPRACGPGDPVIAGTVNGPAGLVVVAERVGRELLLQRIIDLVERARESTAPWERLAARYARAFTPAVFALALAAGALWLLLDGPAKAAGVALAVLVVACPCAMGIATPLATALAIGRAARAGIIVRGGDVLEHIASVRAVFFDKTGTLTANAPGLLRIERLDGAIGEDELLGRLAALESGSEHPLAAAVMAEARRRGIESGPVAGLQIFPGKGLQGRVSWHGVEREVMAGTERFLPAESANAGMAGSAPGTVIHVAWDGHVRGRLFFGDTLRAGAAAAIQQLKAAGIRVALLSGDRLEAARAIGQALGIAEIHAPCNPEDKIGIVRSASGAGRVSAMVGDGINDAPALATAEVGIALGAGADLARQSGNVVLLSNRLGQIAWLVALSRRTRLIIRQNLWWAFGYNGVALAAAALGLLHPLLAAVAMLGSSLTLLANSLRLQRFPDA